MNVMSAVPAFFASYAPVDGSTLSTVGSLELQDFVYDEAAYVAVAANVPVAPSTKGDDGDMLMSVAAAGLLAW